MMKNYFEVTAIYLIVITQKIWKKLSNVSFDIAFEYCTT